MNQTDAAALVVRDYPGGASAVALRLGKSVHTLRHELGGDGTAKLGAEDAQAITQFAQAVKHPNALAILNAFAANCGALVLPLPPALDLSNNECLRDLGACAERFAKLVAEVTGDLAAGKITDNALAAIQADSSRLMASLQALDAACSARNLADKPAHLRAVG